MVNEAKQIYELHLPTSVGQLANLSFLVTVEPWTGRQTYYFPTFYGAAFSLSQLSPWGDAWTHLNMHAWHSARHFWILCSHSCRCTTCKQGSCCQGNLASSLQTPLSEWKKNQALLSFITVLYQIVELCGNVAHLIIAAEILPPIVQGKGAL